MKKNSKFSRLFVYIYILFRFLFKRSEKVDNGCVLIIQRGGIGDALVEANSVLSLSEYYTTKGKKVTIAGSGQVKNVLVNVLGIHALDFIVIENNELTFKSVKRTLSVLGRDGYEVIVSLTPWNNWPSLYIPACLPCNESWGTFPRKNRRIFKCFLFRFYTNRLTLSIDMHQIQRDKLLMKELGMSGFQTEICSIPAREHALPSADGYIVFSVDSANTARRWETNNFIELARRLLERYPYNICLTGVNVEQDVIQQYERSFAGNDRVKIAIGKLSIDDWIETIRESQFVISLDSGAAHVAASTGATCFCLTGVWDGHRIMPYAVDRKMPGTKEPICVYRMDVNVEELECYDCLGKRRVGWGNKECAAQCRSGKPCLCLSKITVDDVMSVIEKAEHDGEIG